MIMAKLQKFGRIRQIHTIISQETVRPFSPTPPHLKLHKLSLIDYRAPHMHLSLVFFYQNYKNGDTNILRKSLSQCLTQYYPFAGRFLLPSANHIDCNDHGVEFLEASIDSRLEDFILKKDQDKSLHQLIPNGLGWTVEKTSPNMLEVQLNHFTCGGVAMAVSISHKIADGFTMLNLCNHWASVTRGRSPTNPSFFNPSISNFKVPEYQKREPCKVKHAKRTFVFPNSEVNELKKKINAMCTIPLNPTRVESLTSLLFKCAVSASTTKSGYSHSSNLCQVVNLRNTIGMDSSKLMAGNLSVMVFAKMVDPSQIELNEVITNLRREIMDINGVRDVEEVVNILTKSELKLKNGQSYKFSSMCRFPYYQVDFGWGKPVRVMTHNGNVGNSFIMMDTPSGDGIEATVQLEEGEMAIFQKDKELLSYAQDI